MSDYAEAYAALRRKQRHENVTRQNRELINQIKLLRADLSKKGDNDKDSPTKLMKELDGKDDFIVRQRKKMGDARMKLSLISSIATDSVKHFESRACGDTFVDGSRLLAAQVKSIADALDDIRRDLL